MAGLAARRPSNIPFVLCALVEVPLKALFQLPPGVPGLLAPNGLGCWMRSQCTQVLVLIDLHQVSFSKHDKQMIKSAEAPGCVILVYTRIRDMMLFVPLAS